jgi:glycosyltransferase involved in cell wall biosynthesis
MASGISVGRLDKSKNLESIINLMYDEELCAIPISLTFVGDATSSNESYVRTLKVKYADLINCGRLKFIGKVPNNDLSVQLARHDFFINGFVGSLDKSLIEATLVGLPVITVNPPYLQEFGSWSEIDSFDNVQDGLKSELLALRQYEKSLIETSRKSRREIAQVKHSRNAWVNKLHEIFLEA